MAGQLLDVGQARSEILAACPRLPAGPVCAGEALGLVLAREVVATADVPGWDNSAMDGIAALPCEAGTTLRVVGESRAGHPAVRAPGAGEAIRISTGAVVPAGPVGVLQRELVDDDGDTVTALDSISEGRNVRRAGDDLGAGQAVLQPGVRLDPAALGVAVAAGAATLECSRRPKVAIVVTGDELKAPGEPLGPGELHDSNLVTLCALAEQERCELVATSKAGDSLEETVAVLAPALDEADVVVCSGGVSVGPHDHVKAALAELGARQCFWRVALKPGKPTWFGTRDGTLAFGLPGNPVSAMVTWILFVRPALAALQGAAQAGPAHVTLGEPLSRNPSRDECVRVRLEGGLAYATGPQGSHVLSSMALADGLAFVPRGEGDLEQGSPVEMLAIGA